MKTFKFNFQMSDVFVKLSCLIEFLVIFSIYQIVNARRYVFWLIKNFVDFKLNVIDESVDNELLVVVDINMFRRYYNWFNLIFSLFWIVFFQQKHMKYEMNLLTWWQRQLVSLFNFAFYNNDLKRIKQTMFQFVIAFNFDVFNIQSNYIIYIVNYFLDTFVSISSLCFLCQFYCLSQNIIHTSQLMCIIQRDKCFLFRIWLFLITFARIIIYVRLEKWHIYKCMLRVVINKFRHEQKKKSIILREIDINSKYCFIILFWRFVWLFVYEWKIVKSLRLIFKT